MGLLIIASIVGVAVVAWLVVIPVLAIQRIGEIMMEKLRLRIATTNFDWMPDWLWFLVASPLLRWSFGPGAPWFVWPRSNADIALDEIAALLDGQEWTSETLEWVAMVIRRTGRTVHDSGFLYCERCEQYYVPNSQSRDYRCPHCLR